MLLQQVAPLSHINHHKDKLYLAIRNLQYNNLIDRQHNHSILLQYKHVKIVKLAYQQLGIRYRYGGSSPREGFDCSGLTRYLYQNGAGIKIPRTSIQQRNKSRTVQYANLKPGDLLFFKTGSKTNHVGVYIGNHQFIHSPNQRSKVKVTTMNNAYWQRRFVKFGTFLGS